MGPEPSKYYVNILLLLLVEVHNLLDWFKSYNSTEKETKQTVYSCIPLLRQPVLYILDSELLIIYISHIAILF